MTKIWTQSAEPREFTQAAFINDIEENLDAYMAVMGCQSLTGRLPNTSLKIRSRHPPADYFEIGGMFIVSARVKAILDEFRVHAEFFPLRIEFKGAEFTETAFYFCNILDCVEGFDLARGKYIFSKKPGFTDRIKEIRKLVIDEAKVMPYDLFRMAKCSPDIICASDKLARSIVDRRLTGMVFVEPKDWRFGL
jgi:hypothetical protein